MDDQHFLDRHLDINEHRRNLPHWHQDGKIQSVTFRLNDSLPSSKLNEYKERKRLWLENHPSPWSLSVEKEYNVLFANYVDRWLDAGYGSCCLKKPEIAQVVEDALFHSNGDRYIIHAFVIMPNHVHLLCELLGDFQLSDFLRGFKGFTAHAINKIMNHKGQVWERESYDRLIRHETHYKIFLNYIEKNIRQGGVRWYLSGVER